MPYLSSQFEQGAPGNRSLSSYRLTDLNRHQLNSDRLGIRTSVCIGKRWVNVLGVFHLSRTLLR